MTISITVPDTPEGREAGLAFFSSLAGKTVSYVQHAGRAKRPEPKEEDVDTGMAQELDEQTRDYAGAPSDAASVFKSKPEPDQEVPLDESGGPVDTAGLPWDERIHSSTGSTQQDGTWKRRRCPKDMSAEEWRKYIAEVEAEIKGAPAPAADPAPTDAPPPPADDTAAPPPPEDKPAPAAITTMPELIKAINAAKMSIPDVNTMLAEYTSGEVKSLPLISARPDKIPGFAKYLGLGA